MKLKMVVLVALIFVASALYASERKVYVVRKGDTLSDVMVTLRLQRVDVSKLMDWNPSLGMHTIVPGQEIIYFVPDAPLPQVSKEQAQREVQEFAKDFAAQEAEHDRHIENLFYCALAIFAALSVGGFVLYGVFMRRGRKAQSMDALPAKTEQPIQLPIHPTLDELREFATRGTRSVPYVFHFIPAKNEEYLGEAYLECTALFPEGDINAVYPLVRFKDDPKERRFSKAYLGAREIVMRRKQISAIQQPPQTKSESPTVH